MAMRQTCAELVAELKHRPAPCRPEKLRFTGIGTDDVYNITAPFLDGRSLVIGGRVEPRSSEVSRVVFFAEEDGWWSPLPHVPEPRLQDPFVTRIRGELVMGGVETFPHPQRPGALGWRTRFYRGRSLEDLEPFAVGPDGMKDIRLVELPNGDIGVFARPQGTIGGRGTIGFTKINSLDNLCPEAINSAQLLEQFVPEEWGGANEVHPLANGLLGVLGHIACFDEGGNRHYYPMTFAFDPNSEKLASGMKIILTRSQLPPGPAKRPDLVDVIFSGGIVRHCDGHTTFYGGISDAEAYRVTICDPFLEYEQIKVGSHST